MHSSESYPKRVLDPKISLSYLFCSSMVRYCFWQYYLLFKGPLSKFSCILKTTHLEKRETETFNIKIQIGISQKPSRKGSKRVEISYFHIFFQWDMSNYFIIWSKQSKEITSLFQNALKCHQNSPKSTQHNIPPVHNIISNEKAGAWASWIGRDDLLQ